MGENVEQYYMSLSGLVSLNYFLLWFSVNRVLSKLEFFSVFPLLIMGRKITPAINLLPILY